MRHKGIKLEKKCRGDECNQAIKGKQVGDYCQKCRWQNRRVVNEAMLKPSPLTDSKEKEKDKCENCEVELVDCKGDWCDGCNLPERSIL